MADAVKDTINKIVEKVESVPVVKLTLTVDEAETLCEIMRRIGGDSETTRREHTDAISIALSAAGVRLPSPRPRVSKTSRSIYFVSPGSSMEDDAYRRPYFTADPFTTFKRIA